MRAGITRAAPTSNRTHKPATIPDPDNANNQKTMSQTDARALYVYDIEHSKSLFRTRCEINGSASKGTSTRGRTIT